MKIYKINFNGDFKIKREININDYIVWDCSGSRGITLKHKKNGKTIFLATKELYDNWKDSYKNQLENIGKYFSYVYDENRKKIRDEKGKPIKKTDTKEELELYKKYFLSKNYIQFKDFTILADLYFKNL